MSSAAEDLLRLAVGDDVADDAEIVAQLGGGEALHELRRLAQLDLEHHREGAVATEAVEVEPGDLPQPIDRIAQAGDALAAFGDRRRHRPLEDRDEQVVLAAEIEVDGAGGDARGASDVGDLGVEEAASGEGVDGGADQQRRACRRARAWPRPANLSRSGTAAGGHTHE